MRKIVFLTAIAGLLLPLVFSAPAQAQATRTWVSGVGDDANPCSRTAPCKTFAGAISKTAASGEINCLDPGGFGAGSGGAIGNVARAGDAILWVSHSTLTNNRAVGGAAGAGPLGQNGRGGAIANFLFGGLALPVTITATTSIDHSTILGNQAIGGAGPTGGTGQGGGIANLNGGVLSVSNSLIALNLAIGGDMGGAVDNSIFPRSMEVDYVRVYQKR